MDKVIHIKDGVAKILTIEELQSGMISEQSLGRLECPCCHKVAHVYHSINGVMAFRAKQHDPECNILLEEDEDEKYKVRRIRIYTDVTLNNDLILYGNDRAPYKLSAMDEAISKIDPKLAMNKYTPDEAERYEEAYQYEFRVKNIESTSSLFKEIKANGYGYNMGDGRIAADLLLDEGALYTFRRSRFTGLKIALLTRCNGDDLKYLNSIGLGNLPGKPIEYVFLKDAYVTDIKNAVIFKVKAKNIEQNNYFKTLIMGSKKDPIKPRDKRNYIVIYTFWTPVPNDFIRVYTADITFRQYALVDDIKIGEVQ